MNAQIFPSLLAADMTCLGEEIRAVMDAGVSMIHMDIMDNHYVPNLTFGPALCHAVHQRFEHLMIDVHLMVTPVDDIIEAFATSGATRISIHPDATLHLDRSLQLIKDLGCQAGIALNPSTPPDCIEWCLHRLDFALIMMVNPGFGGQKLIPDVIKKIKSMKRQYSNLPICVDGGVTTENITALSAAGATEFVVGTTIFKSNDYAGTIAMLHQLSHP